MESCADRICRALRIRDMKQAELSERTGIPKSAISQYCSGAFKPKQQRLFSIAEVLDVNEAWLMGLNAPMERKACDLLPMPPGGISQKLSCISEAEWSRFVLRALINYHDRMTMCDEQDSFNEGLRYALALVENEIHK